MTKYNARRKLDVDIRESLVRSLGDGVFETVIRSNVALGEAQYKAQSIFDYAPSSNGADDYREPVSYTHLIGSLQVHLWHQQ